MLKGFKGRKTGHNGHFHGIPALFQGLEGRLIAQKMCIENWNKIRILSSSPNYVYGV